MKSWAVASSRRPLRQAGKFAKILGIIVIAVAFYFLGFLVGHKNIVFEKNYKPTVVNTSLGKPANVDFSIFWKAWEIVQEKYAGSVSTQDLVYGAVKGMVGALGDPYSSFMEPDQNKLLMQDLSGAIEGIGAEISIKDNKLIVVAPLDNSPAQKAGLKPQDQILEIDGQDTGSMSLDEAISKIRGKAGTEVKLLINRSDFKSPQEFTITREKIVVKSVKYEIKDNIAYIQISQFGDDTSALAKQVAGEIVKQNPRAIILDLRDDPGGYLDAAVDVVSLFMERGVVVKEQYKDGRIVELKTTLDGVLKNYKVVVLINEGSASASEIVAGALRDSRQATLVGIKSFGKGSVQEIEDLQNDTALRITIAKWLTPSGKTIDKEGISPDIEVKISPEDQAANRDPQLDRAIEEAKK